MTLVTFRAALKIVAACAATRINIGARCYGILYLLARRLLKVKVHVFWV